MLNRQLATEIEKVASRNALTGTFNRRMFDDEMASLESRCSLTGDKFLLLLIDVDHFKSINDNYGHLKGEEILRELANIVLSIIRTEDYFARFGGDEFFVLLPSTDTTEVFLIAYHLHEKYALATFKAGDKFINTSLSIGVVNCL